jgi:hypothetical protein
MVERNEERSVQQLVARSLLNLDERIQLSLARRDVVSFDLCLL